MAEPYVRTTKLNYQGKNIILCCVVLDLCDYISLVDFIAERYSISDVEHFKAAKHIPAIMRGTKTEFIFSKFRCADDVTMLSVIVRGMGSEMVKNLQPNFPSFSFN